MSDAADLAPLLARTALGDRAAFEALYRASSRHLFGAILRIQPDRTQAEELLQDVYIKVWHHAGAFETGRAQPMAWLASIARHAAIDSLRRARARVQTVSTSLADDEDDTPDLLARLPDPAPGPLALLQDAAEQRQVRHCVGELSAEQQQCVALAYYQGLSHSELAEHLAQPLGTVKGWLRRALQSLKACLGRAAGVA